MYVRKGLVFVYVNLVCFFSLINRIWICKGVFSVWISSCIFVLVWGIVFVNVGFIVYIDLVWLVDIWVGFIGIGVCWFV